MYSLIKHFAQDERGATSIEYGLIAAGIGVAVITLVGQVGDQIHNIFSNLDSQLGTFNASLPTQ